MKIRKPTLIPWVIGILVVGGTVLYLASQGVHLTLWPTTVRTATAADVFYRDTRGIPARSLAVVEGPFQYGDSHEVGLYHVHDGAIVELTDVWNGIGTVRGLPWWFWQRSIFALGEKQTPDGTIFMVFGAGGSGGGGGISTVPLKLDLRHLIAFEGNLVTGKTYLLRVEGDGKPIATRTMSVTEFAEANPNGQFLVLTVTHHNRESRQLERARRH